MQEILHGRVEGRWLLEIDGVAALGQLEHTRPRHVLLEVHREAVRRLVLVADHHQWALAQVTVQRHPLGVGQGQPLEILQNVAVDGGGDLWVRSSNALWRLPADGVGLARMEFVIANLSQTIERDRPVLLTEVPPARRAERDASMLALMAEV